MADIYSSEPNAHPKLTVNNTYVTNDREERQTQYCSISATVGWKWLRLR